MKGGSNQSSRVLVCDYVHHDLLQGLGDLGYRVVYAPEIQSPQVSSWLGGMAGVIVNTRTPIKRQLIESNPNLKFIGRLGVGLDIIDVESAKQNDVAVISTPGANANAVAEHMFGMLLALFRKILSADHTVRKGKWLREAHRGREIQGSTIGIIGYGNTGSAFAEKFANWQTQVVAYDKFKVHYADDKRFVQECTLDEVLAVSDVISLHVPLTSETLGMIDHTLLQQCKRGVVILNGSRGKVVDMESLLNGIESGQVGGACLDVLENEKIGTYREEEVARFELLTRKDNVILTPHIAGWTHRSFRNIARQMLDGISNLRDETNAQT